MDFQLFFRNNLVVIVLYIVCLCLLYRRQKPASCIWHLVGLVCFCTLMTMVYIVTGVTPMSGFHTDLRWGDINWDFIGSIKEMLSFHDIYGYLNVFGNIILFMPLGFFLPLLNFKNQRFWKVTFYGFGLSLLIEAWQMFLLRGTDVMDLILNTLGAAIGYLVFLLFRILFRKFSARFCSNRTSTSFAVRAELLLAVFLPMVVTILWGFIDRYNYGFR